MSELMNARNDGRDFRRQLLTTVSALALLVAVYGSSEAQAADQDADRPTVWIELGGSFNTLSDSSQAFDPAFLSTYAANGLKSPLFTEQAPHYGFDEEAKISFQPGGSDWVLSAAIKYGRTTADKNFHQQFKNPYAYLDKFTFVFGSFHVPAGGYSYYPTHHVKFADDSARQSEVHSVMDFEAGKDVGLGMFGLDGSSVISAGVRVAQFLSKSNIDINAQPDVHYPSGPLANNVAKYDYMHTKIHLHDYTATETGSESFNGLGPKLDWDASTPVIGNDQNGEITFDWGASVAVLFGRQKASGSHQSAVKSYYLTQFVPGFGAHPGLNALPGAKIPPVRGHWINPGPCHLTNDSNECTNNPPPTSQHTNAPQVHRRSRMAAVPNLGGFAGISVKYSNAKFSFGYRADEFFGAMDGGIDAAKRENRGFNGLFATFSVGLGG